MISLTFGEQVKIVLSRKDMTIKELAEEIEARYAYDRRHSWMPVPAQHSG